MTVNKEAAVLVAIPSHSFWEADFGMSLASLVAKSVEVPEGFSSLALAVQNTKGSILPQIRYELVCKAQEIGATHILFLDSDMSFPADTLHRLLKANRPIVAANCVTKTIPPNPTARFKSDVLGGTPVPIADWDGEQYVEVWRVGTGVMLVEMEVFAQLPMPWFPLGWDDGLGKVVGEDWGFCMLCEESGIPIVIDTELSKEIGHIGRLEYTPWLQAKLT